MLPPFSTHFSLSPLITTATRVTCCVLPVSLLDVASLQRAPPSHAAPAPPLAPPTQPPSLAAGPALRAHTAGGDEAPTAAGRDGRAQLESEAQQHAPAAGSQFLGNKPGRSASGNAATSPLCLCTNCARRACSHLRRSVLTASLGQVQHWLGLPPSCCRSESPGAVVCLHA